jgi:hypothetical protein
LTNDSTQAFSDVAFFVAGGDYDGEGGGVIVIIDDILIIG